MKNHYPLCVSLLFIFELFSGCTPQIEEQEEPLFTRVQLRAPEETPEDELETFSHFYLNILSSENDELHTVAFDSYQAAPALSLNPGEYRFNVLCNLHPDCFEVPGSHWQPDEILRLSEDAAFIPMVCQGFSEWSVLAEDTAIPVQLKRKIGKLNVDIQNPPESVSGITLIIKNMLDAFNVSGEFQESTRTWRLEMDESENGFELRDALLFPSAGNLKIAYEIHEENRMRTYTSLLEIPLAENKIINLNTTIEDIRLSVTPDLSVLPWEEPVSVDNGINPELPSSSPLKVRFINMASDFTAVSGVVRLVASDNTVITVRGGIEKNEFQSTLPVEWGENPDIEYKIVRASFVNAANANYSVYYDTSTATALLSRSGEWHEITLPDAPVPGDIVGGGLLTSRIGTSGYKAYQGLVVGMNEYEGNYGETVPEGITRTTLTTTNRTYFLSFCKADNGYTETDFPAFRFCKEYTAGSFSDWSLPDERDLKQVLQFLKENKTLFETLVSGNALNGLPDTPTFPTENTTYVSSGHTSGKCIHISYPALESSEEPISTPARVRPVRWL